MPVYNAPLLKINQTETRRYAGLMKASFDEKMIADACLEAQLLAKPQGIWQVYDYDAKKQIVWSQPTFSIKGKKIGTHLAGAEKVILLAATVGEQIETAITKYFNEGRYAFSMLLDAAATTAVEQIADAMEKTIQPKIKAQGYSMRWRFSPGYGDWSILQQPELVRLSQASSIGISLTESMMLMPRKSITAIIGLIREKPDDQAACLHGCLTCNKKDCLARKK